MIDHCSPISGLCHITNRQDVALLTSIKAGFGSKEAVQQLVAVSVIPERY